MKQSAIVLKLVVTAAVAAVVVVVLGVFLPRWQQIRELRRREAELAARNRRTASLSEELRVKSERFASEAAFVELTAREMGMIRKGEIVFKFTNNLRRTHEQVPD